MLSVEYNGNPGLNPDPNRNRLLAQVSPKNSPFLGYILELPGELRKTRIRSNLNQNLPCGAWILVQLLKASRVVWDMQARFGADDVEIHRRLPVSGSPSLCCLAQSRPIFHAEAGRGERPCLPRPQLRLASPSRRLLWLQDPRVGKACSEGEHQRPPARSQSPFRLPLAPWSPDQSCSCRRLLL